VEQQKAFNNCNYEFVSKVIKPHSRHIEEKNTGGKRFPIKHCRNIEKMDIRRKM
jgi:hypothetical protein